MIACIASSAWKSWVRPMRRDASTMATGSKAVAPVDGELRRCQVAVIGAGAAGLAAAKELRAEGHNVVVFEQGSSLGGVWAYDERVEESDLLGRDWTRPKVHSSMYQNLRTNLPREIMSFTEFPFTPEVMGPRYSVDSRRFCGHKEVLNYLHAYADFYKLHDALQLQVRVLEVAPEPGSRSSHSRAAGAGQAGSSDAGGLEHALEGPLTTKGGPASHHGAAGPSLGPQRYSGQWRVRTQRLGSEAAASSSVSEGSYDAVLICNGHYSEPNLPQVASTSSSFPGTQMHSHNYRTPLPFKDQVVLVVGASNSGEDISREVSECAERVILSARSWKSEAWGPGAQPYGARNNIYRYPLVQELTADGMAVFPDGSKVGPIHSVIYCTGYRYTFPFLPPTILQQADAPDTAICSSSTAAISSSAVKGNVLESREQHIYPLYLHMFPPLLAPSLSFLGLPWKIVPFPQFELQARLVARALSGRVVLPSPEDMQRSVEQHFDKLERSKVPLRYAHMQGDEQWQYNDLLATMCGPDVEPLPAWRSRMYAATGTNKRGHPDKFRDGPWTVEDQEALHAARQEAGRKLETMRAAGWEAGAMPAAL